MTAVLHVVLSLQPGGAERLVIDLCSRLADEFDSAVCCLDEPGAWASRLPAGVPVVSLHRAAGFHPSLARRIRRTATDSGATVIHCHQYSPFIYGALAGAIGGRLRVVATEHGRLGDEQASLKRRIANRLVNLLPVTTFAVSSALREHLISEGFPAGRVKVIHNGVDPGLPADGDARERARAALGLETDVLAVGSAGRLNAVKDFPTLIASFALLRLRGHRARLVLIGDGPERDALQRQVTAAGMDAVISLVGYREDVRALLPALDLFVNSSIYEGVSLTILEAMASAIAVVATRVGGTPDVVQDGKTGLLVPARAPESLAAAMDGLLRDRARRDVFGQNGRARVLQAFTIDQMVNRYAAIYRTLEAA